MGRRVESFVRLTVAMALSFAGGGCEQATLCGKSDASACSAGMFCKVADGACDQDEASGVCTLRPIICPLSSSPVCGCDGVTYANPCLAESVGINIARAGSCEEERCCDPRAEPGFGDNPACIEGATCCSDGAWRCNEGDLSTTCDAVGEVCTEVCGGIAGTSCSAETSYCRVGVGECCCDIQGVCVPRPDVCIEIFVPVCGCDGVTYSNECFAAAAGISIDHAGECDSMTGG